MSIDNNLDKIWNTDWQERLTRRVRELGHNSISDFAKQHADCSVDEMVQILGSSQFAPIQLHGELLREAMAHGRLRDVAIDLLVRAIRSIPGGWPASQGWQELTDVRTELIAWQVCLPPEQREHASPVVDWLLNNPGIPAGWVPCSASDPIIADAFVKWAP